MDKKITDLEKKFIQTRDKLGLIIDKGILQTVIALNANNIPTFASCEGHLDHGEPFPWVDLGNPKDGKLKDLLQTADRYWKQAKQSDIRVAHQFLEKYHQTMNLVNVLSLRQVRSIFEKLESFYSKHNPPYGLRIISTTVGPFIRIQPEDGISQLLRNPEDKKNKLKLYLEEFNRFYNFLVK